MKKDFNKAKKILFQEYTESQIRSEEEVAAFLNGMNYLIDYIEYGREETLNDSIPSEVLYNERTFKQLRQELQQEFETELDTRLKAQAENYERKLKAQREEIVFNLNTYMSQEDELPLNTLRLRLSAKPGSAQLIHELTEQMTRFLGASRYMQQQMRKDHYVNSLRTTIEGLNKKLQEKPEIVKTVVKRIMPVRKVVIAIDSFKGCLTSTEAGNAAAEGVSRAVPDCQVIRVPISDGGEGLLDTRVPDPDKRIFLKAHGPLMEETDTCYGIDKDGETAVIETARINGLPLVPEDRRNPLLTTTYGVGELIADALNRGYRKFLIGLGGSATNDAGLGMLQALGYRFFDAEGHEIQETLCGGLLTKVASIDSRHAHPALAQAHFLAVCDVRNPLFGPNGAACVYAPQKGADMESVKRLDLGLRHIGEVMWRTTGSEFLSMPGCGAAGGMGAALAAFLKAELKPGIRVLLEELHIGEWMAGADLVLTGEGKSDQQTLMGKVPQGVLEMANARGIPTILVSGAVEDAALLLKGGFRAVFSIQPAPLSLEEAMSPQAARKNITQTVEQVCRTVLCKAESAK